MLPDPLAPVSLVPDLNEESPALIEAGCSLDFLRAVYADPGQPMQRRMRAAIAALPFEHPKLAVTASIGQNSGFAARLEEAISRTAEMRAGPVIQLSASTEDSLEL